MREIKFSDKSDFIIDEELGNIEVAEEGSDELSVILNYPRSVIYTLKKDDTLKKLKTMGYFCEELSAEENDVVFLTRKYENIHIVKPLETLHQIAKTYNLSEEQLISKNNLKTTKLFIGQTLNL